MYLKAAKQKASFPLLQSTQIFNHHDEGFVTSILPSNVIVLSGRS